MPKKNNLNLKEALRYINLRSRDNARTPFWWDNTLYAGFSTVKPWIKMTDGYKDINTNNNKLLEFYKKCINLRIKSEFNNVFTFGSIKFNRDNPYLFNFIRSYENKSAQFVINFSEEIQKVKIENINNIILNTIDSLDIEDELIIMKPFQGIVLSV
ncbi:Putative Oligo 1,6 glucosidase [Spiroplasma turonicum]|uniref:Putative Oligo 1,6 glucosidase n=2 Tax=Spiroplasma turonicum TaxID=216946 RepID=A0A0K1P7H2_9MOLU|nr:Putative Oligo 1,6 glucosidase [Spiroplasma turonicum]